MSDTATTGEQSTDDLAVLREQAKQGQRLAKENAFLRAGVDLATPINQTLFAAYSGEMTIEAIDTFFATNGITKNAGAPAASATTGDPQTQTADDGQQLMREAIAGAGGQAAGAAPVTVPVDAREEAWAAFHSKDGANRTRTEEDRQLELIDRFISGAAEGKQEFLFDEKKWLAERAAVGFDFRPLRAKGSPLPSA